MAQTIAPWFAALRQAGAKGIYLLGILPELLSPSTSPFPVIVPIGEGADAKAIGQLLCGSGSVKGPVTLPTCATVHNAVFAGTNEALERIRQLKPVERPELAAAFAALGDTGTQIVLTPGADTRRVVEEMLPILPKELGGGPITGVTRGLLWTAVDLTPDPEPRLQFVVQAKDAESAQALNALGKKQPSVPPPVAPGAPVRTRLRQACRRSRGRGQPGSDHGYDGCSENKRLGRGADQAIARECRADCVYQQSQADWPGDAQLP
jgi:hypothetical protein